MPTKPTSSKMVLPKWEGLSSDIEDRRKAPREPKGIVDLRSEHAFDRSITERTAGEVSEKFGAPYMEALGDSWIVRQEGRMAETAKKQMDIQARHDATKAARQRKTAREYKGAR